MPIQVWLARMERPLTEQEYGDMMALLPDARRERLEKLPKEKHQEVLCAYLLLRMALWEQRGWRDLPRIEVDELGKPFFPDPSGYPFQPQPHGWGRSRRFSGYARLGWTSSASAP